MVSHYDKTPWQCHHWYQLFCRTMRTGIQNQSQKTKHQIVTSPYTTLFVLSTASKSSQTLSLPVSNGIYINKSPKTTWNCGNQNLVARLLKEHCTSSSGVVRSPDQKTNWIPALSAFLSVPFRALDLHFTKMRYAWIPTGNWLNLSEIFGWNIRELDALL